MSKVFTILLVLILGVSGAEENKKTFGTLKIKKIIRVYDGDTFYVNLKKVHPLLGDTIAIRIDDIDTPERRGSSPCVKEKAMEVRAYVEKRLLDGKKVVLKNCQRGKYFRILADVYIDGISLSEELIALGYAKPYDGGTKPEWACE